MPVDAFNFFGMSTPGKNVVTLANDHLKNLNIQP